MSKSEALPSLGSGDAIASPAARREREHARAARAQAARERERTRQATERADALAAELAAIRNSAAYRLTYPVRWLASALPASLYAAVRGKPAIGMPREQAATSDTTGVPVDCGSTALLIDDWFPEPDRDSGSIDIVNMAEQLLKLGFHVYFGADKEHATSSRRRVGLADRGIVALGVNDGPSIEDFVGRAGSSLGLVVLNRLYCGGRFFEVVRRDAPEARILFNTVDLHWVRMDREAKLLGDADLLKAAATARSRELFLAREADAVIVVSSSECEMLSSVAPDAFVVQLPLARPVSPPIAPFEARSGIGFIGGFRHAPNLDALRWFVTEALPAVRRRHPDCRFSVVGPDLPPDFHVGLPEPFDYLGYLPDLRPWFESLRATVAPLRFGAGAKGKIVTSLAAGVPCVATGLALEGMGLGTEDGALVAATPEEFADQIASLHCDAARWQRLSSAAVHRIDTDFSIQSWRDRLAEALWTLDALPPTSASAR